MKFRFILLGILVISSVRQVSALGIIDRKDDKAEQDSVKVSINYLKYFLNRQGHWYPQSYQLEQRMRGLVHHVEDENVDSLLYHLNTHGDTHDRYFFRTPDNVEDSLSVPGYVPYTELKEQMGRIDRSVRSSILKEQIPVPEQLLENVDKRVHTLSKDEAYKLLGTSYVSIPDSLTGFGSLPDSLMTNPDDLRRLQRMDSTKRALLENARQEYNAGVIRHFVDSVSSAYRQEYIRQYSLKKQREYVDSIRFKNYRTLTQYNDAVMAAVNDSIKSSLRILSNYVNAEQLSFWFHNSDKDSVQVFLSNSSPTQSRMFVKNEQNDSLGIRVQALDRNEVRLLIDDGGVTFTRFAQRRKKDVRFEPLKLPSSLQKVNKRFNVITPWTLAGTFNAGITQTYYNNWSSGGTSSLATLFVFKGSANYSSKKTSWENSLEIRNGWLKPSDDGLEKNDDKFEFITKYGIQAYKKWYYSAEIDFETQLFKGYDYPDRETPISGFLSPAKTLIKLGMDYKPSKNLSLLISPLTAKTVFVRDTAEIDQTKFGISENKSSLWQTGLNADLSWKKEFTPDISWQTKYKMFINYKEPFSKFDIDWQNTFTFQLSHYINMQALFHMVYDDDVTFATNRVDAEGNTIYKPKWQIKEFITLGFTYKLNKPIYRRERLR